MKVTHTMENAIGHLGKYHNTLYLSPQILQKHCFVFSWGGCKSQEKLETMFMQNLGRQTKSIMVFFQVAYISHDMLSCSSSYLGFGIPC